MQSPALLASCPGFAAARAAVLCDRSRTSRQRLGRAFVGRFCLAGRAPFLDLGAALFSTAHPFYFPLKRGGRFSLKLRIPSWKSADASSLVCVAPNCAAAAAAPSPCA